jgi:hypothetical protein
MNNHDTIETNGESPSNLDLVYKLGGDFREGIDVVSLCPMLSAIADLIKTGVLPNV